MVDVLTGMFGWAHGTALANKLDQAAVEILRYVYDADDRLTNRWSKAKGNTAYSYDSVGDLTLVNYPVSHDITLTYDALSRLTNMVDAVGTTVYTYDSVGQLLTEDGPFASDTVTNTYANRLRVALSLQQPTGAWTNGFGYDPLRRLTNVTSQAGAFGYAYSVGGVVEPGSLIRRLNLPNMSYVTNSFDNVARLTGTWLNDSGNGTLDSALYGYNQGNQRATFTNAAGTYYQYAYDNIGQLKVADSSVNSEDRGYFYDAAWNLNRRTNNGVMGTFSVDGKNELTNAPGSVGNLAYDDNGNLTNSWSGKEQFAYDDENQLVQWFYYQNGPSTPTAGDLRTDFVYDGKMRLRKRLEYSLEVSTTNPPPDSATSAGQTDSADSGGSGSTWNLVSETHYVYDGNRVIQERDGSNNPLVSYTRGTDLSGSLEGAGGIGGLLGRSSGYSSGNWTSQAYYHADGNGNITYLVNSSQTLAASYRYDPYGNLLSGTGTLASANVYRFSSKEVHANSGMYYYLYRFYEPNLQRWINTDPVTETGFTVLAYTAASITIENSPLQLLEGEGESANAYGFADDAPTLSVDPYGLKIRLWPFKKKPNVKPTPVFPFPSGGPGHGGGISGKTGSGGIGFGICVGAQPSQPTTPIAGDPKDAPGSQPWNRPGWRPLPGDPR